MGEREREGEEEGGGESKVGYNYEQNRYNSSACPTLLVFSTRKMYALYIVHISDCYRVHNK